MAGNTKLKRCEQKRFDCFAFTSKGCCKCLNNTSFKDEEGRTYKCPFFKKRTAVQVDFDKYEVGNEND